MAFWMGVLVLLAVVVMAAFTVAVVVAGVVDPHAVMGNDVVALLPLMVTNTIIFVPAMFCLGIWLLMAVLLRVRLQHLATTYRKIDILLDRERLFADIGETASMSDRMSNRLAFFFVPFIAVMLLRFIVNVSAVGEVVGHPNAPRFSVVSTAAFAVFTADLIAIPFAVGAHTTTASSLLRKSLANRYIELCKAGDVSPEVHDAFRSTFTYMAFEKHRLRLRFAGLSMTGGLLTKVLALLTSLGLFLLKGADALNQL